MKQQSILCAAGGVRQAATGGVASTVTHPNVAIMLESGFVPSLSCANNDVLPTAESPSMRSVKACTFVRPGLSLEAS